jgi:hypothetical protein
MGAVLLCWPQVLYQGEGMVELLVACQAHHYLEFKLIEGRCALRSYMLSCAVVLLRCCCVHTDCTPCDSQCISNALHPLAASRSNKIQQQP